MFFLSRDDESQPNLRNIFDISSIFRSAISLKQKVPKQGNRKSGFNWTSEQNQKKRKSRPYFLRAIVSEKKNRFGAVVN